MQSPENLLSLLNWEKSSPSQQNRWPQFLWATASWLPVNGLMEKVYGKCNLNEQISTGTNFVSAEELSNYYQKTEPRLKRKKTPNNNNNQNKKCDFPTFWIRLMKEIASLSKPYFAYVLSYHNCNYKAPTKK